MYSRQISSLRYLSIEKSEITLKYVFCSKSKKLFFLFTFIGGYAIIFLSGHPNQVKLTRYKMSAANVFNIQKFSINDGPGIRTTVFVKGCPLNCAWCHNPESKKKETELLFHSSRCTLCGGCVKACDSGVHAIKDGVHLLKRESCSVSGKCAEVCPYGALELCGKLTTAEEAFAEVLRDKVFYETSGGGMTVSGGEPLFSFDFTYELLQLAKAGGIHTAIETCGFAPSERIERVAQFTDLFLFDIKETDSERHKRYTGADNALILSNLELINKLGVPTVLRCPIIPGYNDRDEHFSAIADIANRYDAVTGIDVEPYHPLGESKAEGLGIDYALHGVGFPEEELVKEWIEKVASRTSKPTKRG